MPPDKGQNDSGNQQAARLLTSIHHLVKELHPEQSNRHFTLDSSLDRDMGLDSLSRIELLVRLEKVFDLSFPEQAIIEADTPRDILRHITRKNISSPEIPRDIEISPAPFPESIEVPSAASALVEILDHHAATHPQQPHILIEEPGKEHSPLTYGELHEGSRKVAAGLQHLDLQPGSTVAIILPTGREYFFSFLGVLLAGGIPVPLYPPVRPSQIEEHLRRHSGILRNAQTDILITMPEIKPVARLLQLQIDSLRHIRTYSELVTMDRNFIPVPVQPGDIAFLQYTSGSTGDPKGVILTNSNLLANIRAMGQAAEVTSKDVFVSWLPLYHDMGLIGAWLGSLYYGCKLVIMPPLSFVARPERWLIAIHKYRGTISASPNFGYELCFRRIKEQDIANIDLSCWRLAFNGAEPVSPGSIRNFSSRFAAYGFKQETMAPVYGLAESSVGLAFPPLGRKPLIDRIDREKFSRSGRAIIVADTNLPTLEFVACGRPLPGHQIRIIDENGRELPERMEGKLQFMGPSSSSGYFRSPDKTAELFSGSWLNSGDLAYIAEGDVYITGRSKDIIIKGGRNIYPHELEEAVGNIDGIRQGSVAVFGSRNGNADTERLIVLVESRKKDQQALDNLRLSITDLSIDLLGMPPDDIVIAPPGAVLKTSSGKIRRSANRLLYQQDRIGRKQRVLWLQVAAVFFSGFIPSCRKLLGQSGDYLYAGWCWTCYCILAPVAWLLVMLLPTPASRWRMTSAMAGLLATFTGTRIMARDIEKIPRNRPIIFVANHMSYLDAYVLQAVLPVPCSFIAKAELADKPLLKKPLTRLGAIFVKRSDRRQGIGDTEKIAATAAQGKNLLFFPEATFQRMPGLLPFRMGAFLVSSRSGVPIVPITIRGTRNKLRADSWFPRRGHVIVRAGSPINPSGNNWQAAIKLKNNVRRTILKHLGEPDLGGTYTGFSDTEPGQQD